MNHLLRIANERCLFCPSKNKTPPIYEGDALQAFGFIIIVCRGPNANHVKGEYEHDDPKC